ncbi:MAG: tetratricopeptide repeat protein [Pseudomonadaceae bacterium]|nr:tetratricopeptide repeat protein [Pseudomonadaceae bacterium]
MSDYLSEEEQVQALKTWWEENGTSLVVGVVLVLGSVFGWRWYQSYSADQAASASDLYQDYLLAEEDAKPEVIAEIDSQIAGTSYQAFVKMTEARRALDGGDLDAAAGELEAALDAAKGSYLEGLVRVRLARLYQQQQRTDDALAQLALVKGAGYESQAAELRGDIHYAAGDREQAAVAYQVAADLLAEGDARPLLELKLMNTAAADVAANESDDDADTGSNPDA